MAQNQQNQSTTPKTPTAPDTSAGGNVSKPSADLGADEVQDKVDEETDQGYRGFTNDEGDYTVGGSVAGKNMPDAGKNTEGK